MSTSVKLNQIETATRLILTGRETLESCSVKFGRNWPSIETPVNLSLKLTKLGETFGEKTAEEFRREVISSKLQKYKQAAGAVSMSPFDSVRNKPVILQKNNYLFNLFTTFKPNKGRARALIRILVILLLFLMGGGLFCSIAEASQPGDLLYPTKLQLEKIPTIWQFDEEAKNQASLNYAQSRLDELRQAFEQDPSVDVTQTLAFYEDAIKEVTENSSAGISKEMSEQLARQQETLKKLEEKSGNNKEVLRRIMLLEEAYRTRQRESSAPAQTPITYQPPTAALTPKPTVVGPASTKPGTTPEQILETPGVEPTVTLTEEDKRRQLLLLRRKYLEEGKDFTNTPKPDSARTPNPTPNPAQTQGAGKNTPRALPATSETRITRQPAGETPQTTPSPENTLNPNREKLKQAVLRLKEEHRTNKASRF